MRPAPTCPFCQQSWTDAMLEEFARFSSAQSCHCCNDPHHAAEPAPLPMPERDLCCDHCGKAIYRKP